MLRGYQPLKELERWLLVIATLVVPFAVLFEIVNGVSLSLLGNTTALLRSFVVFQFKPRNMHPNRGVNTCLTCFFR